MRYTAYSEHCSSLQRSNQWRGWSSNEANRESWRHLTRLLGTVARRSLLLIKRTERTARARNDTKLPSLIGDQSSVTMVTPRSTCPHVTQRAILIMTTTEWDWMLVSRSWRCWRVIWVRRTRVQQPCITHRLCTSMFTITLLIMPTYDRPFSVQWIAVPTFLLSLFSPSWLKALAINRVGHPANFWCMLT